MIILNKKTWERLLFFITMLFIVSNKVNRVPPSSQVLKSNNKYPINSSNDFSCFVYRIYQLTQFDYFESFSLTSPCSQKVFFQQLNRMVDNQLSTTEFSGGLCDPLVKLFNLVSNEAFDNLLQVLHKNNVVDNLSKEHLAMLSFLLIEPGARELINEKTVNDLIISSQSKIELSLRTGQILSGNTANALVEQLLVRAGQGKLLYIGTSDTLIDTIQQLLPGVYTLSINEPIAHTVSIQVTTDSKINVFDPSNGLINISYSDYFMSINKEYYGINNFTFQISAYYGMINECLYNDALIMHAKPSFSSLITAIMLQDLVAIDKILTVTPQFLTDINFPLVHIAVIKEKVLVLEHLLTVHQLSPKSTQLPTAIMKNKPLAIIECLLLHGADPNFFDENNKASLLLAVENAYPSVDVVDRLLKAGGDVLVKDNTYPLIVIAVLKSSPAVVARLLQDPRLDPSMSFPIRFKNKGVKNLTLQDLAKNIRQDMPMLSVIQTAIQKWKENTVYVSETTSLFFLRKHRKEKISQSRVNSESLKDSSLDISIRA